MQLSISLNAGWLTWAWLKQLAPVIERLGFTGIYCSDHFGRLEPILALAYLATHSSNLQIGTLVSPLSFRDPVMLARQAMTIDDLSGGRMILGIGAGWTEPEHAMFGYTLGDMPLRAARFAEGAEVIARLIRSSEPVTFDGRFYKLRDALLLPRATRPTPLLIGGKGQKYTLPLVARHADIWNCQLASLAEFKQCSMYLDELLLQVGRQARDVKRTLLIPIACGRDAAELERYAMDVQKTWTHWAHMTPHDVLDKLHTDVSAIVGTPDKVIEQLKSYEAAGVEEVMVGYITPGSTESLETLAKYVLPHIARTAGSSALHLSKG